MLKFALLACLLGATPALATELEAPAEERFQQDVAWSPDGKWIAFSEFSGGSYTPDKWSVFIERTDGSEKRQIAAGATYVSWSPDGKKLVYGVENGSGRGLFATSIDSNLSEQLTDLKHRDRQPAWSPDGAQLAFVSDRGDIQHVFLLKLADKSVRQLTTGSLKDYNPQWSPKGNLIVFYREKPGGQDDIYTVAPDGTGLKAVTADSALDTFPGFHPNGDIVFSSKENKGAPARLVQMHPDGSGRQFLLKPATFFGRVSPDGKRIAFIGGGWPRSAVYLLNLADSQVNKIVN